MDLISFWSFKILFCQITILFPGLSSLLQEQYRWCNSRKEAGLMESARQGLSQIHVLLPTWCISFWCALSTLPAFPWKFSF